MPRPAEDKSLTFEVTNFADREGARCPTDRGAKITMADNLGPSPPWW